MSDSFKRPRKGLREQVRPRPGTCSSAPRPGATGWSGHWAAALLGKTGDDAAAYAVEVVKADFEEAGDEDVVRKLKGDLGDLADEATIRAKLAECMAIAKAQLMDETS